MFRKHSRRVWALAVLYSVVIAVALVENLLDPGAEFAPVRWVVIAIGTVGLTGCMAFEGFEFRRTS